jgi:hypothetical protein
MRKIQTEKEREKEKKKNQIIIGAIMIGLLVFSTLGYSFMSSSNNKSGETKKTEFGIDFFRENGYWKAVIGDKSIIFRNLPSEVSDVDVDISMNISQYNEQPLYFVNPSLGSSEVLNNIGGYVLRYQEACDLLEENSEENLCEGDLPVKNCDNNIIIFREGNKTKVYQNNNCIYIIGDDIKGADAFLYELLGIN